MTPLYDSKQVLTENSIDYFLAMEDLDKVAEKMNVSAHTLKNYLYGKKIFKKRYICSLNSQNHKNIFFKKLNS